MPLIRTISPAEAHGELRETYGQIQAALGGVPAAFQLASLSPPLVQNQLQFIGYYQGHPTLSATFLAFLRSAVSTEMHCDYCIDFNGALLINHFGWSTEQLASAKRDLDSAPLADNEKALIRFCVDAVRNAGRVDITRLDTLRQLGWNDRDILDAVIHAARNMSSDIVINTFGLKGESIG